MGQVAVLERWWELGFLCLAKRRLRSVQKQPVTPRRALPKAWSQFLLSSSHRWGLGGSGWARELLAPEGVMALDKVLWGWGLCPWGFAGLSCTKAVPCSAVGALGAAGFLRFRHHLAHRHPYFCLEPCLCCSAFW